MKKLLIIFVIIVFGISSIYANQSANVSAVVWSANKAPYFTYFNPTSNPLLVKRWTSKVINFWVMDDEWEHIDIFISANNWVVNPIYTSVTWSWSLNFVYLAPSTISWSTLNSKISIVLNDSVNPVVKDINLMIY